MWPASKFFTTLKAHVNFLGIGHGVSVAKLPAKQPLVSWLVCPLKGKEVTGRN